MLLTMLLCTCGASFSPWSFLEMISCLRGLTSSTTGRFWVLIFQSMYTGASPPAGFQFLSAIQGTSTTSVWATPTAIPTASYSHSIFALLMVFHYNLLNTNISFVCAAVYEILFLLILHIGKTYLLAISAATPSSFELPSLLSPVSSPTINSLLVFSTVIVFLFVVWVIVWLFLCASSMSLCKAPWPWGG